MRPTCQTLPLSPDRAVEPDASRPLAATAAEQVHSILRRMSDADWTRLKVLLCQRLAASGCEAEVEVLEQVFRRHRLPGAQAGGVVFRLVQAMISDPLLRDEIRQAQEHVRRRVRWVLREMSDWDWNRFKESMSRALRAPTQAEDIRVLELVFRTGESISNVEVAAAAKAEKRSGRRLIDPEVARRNALVRARQTGSSAIDVEAAYTAAKRMLETARQTAERAEHTLAYSLVEPTAGYRHARHTVFKWVDAIVETEELMRMIVEIEQRLAAVKPVTREQMRWALHRMPLSDRISVIKLIPLNTILMFQEAAEEPESQDPRWRASRDRWLAHDLFVKGQSDEELKAKYRCSLPALKSAVGTLLNTLVQRPLACQVVRAYLERMERIAPMGTDEVRRAMKRLTEEQRVEILNRIPPCAWKVRDVMPVHKRLFLDYLSGEWVLSALVNHYNLQNHERLSGTFKREGSLTVRGAGAAIAGLLRKIADEPELRQRLRDWNSAASPGDGPQESEIIDLEKWAVHNLIDELPAACRA
jgi:hypothetical protein